MSHPKAPTEASGTGAGATNPGKSPRVDNVHKPCVLFAEDASGAVVAAHPSLHYETKIGASLHSIRKGNSSRYRTGFTLPFPLGNKQLAKTTGFGVKCNDKQSHDSTPMSIKFSLPNPRFINTAIPPLFVRTTMAPLDHSLVTVASDALLAVPLNPDNHTVASAVRTDSGSTFTGINVYHFSGGPCAELVALGAAAGGGVLATGIKTIVAVKKDEDTGKVGVINPCGRCRQVLFDYNANMDVIVSDEKAGPRICSVRELLPFAPYVWDPNMEQR